MGRVKDFYWDEINAAAEADRDKIVNDEPPTDLEYLEMDLEMARERFGRATAREGKEANERAR